MKNAWRCYFLGHRWDLKHVMALLEQMGHTIHLIRCARCHKLKALHDKQKEYIEKEIP